MWTYPHSADVLREAGLKTIKHYIDKRRNTIATTIQDRPILEECRRAERLTGTPCRLRWWQQRLDYTGEEEREGGGGGGLKRYSPHSNPRPASRPGAASHRRPQSTSTCSSQGAAMRPREDEGRGTAEEEAAIDALFRAAHFAD